MSILPKINIIVLNWNNAKDTLECLESIYTIDYPKYELIVVDNGSTDNSLSLIKQAFPKATYIENKENLGYVGGNNAGISYSLKTTADYFFILNNDTVIAKDILSAFAEAAIQHPNAGVLGGKIFYYDKPHTIWHAGGYWSEKQMKGFHIDENTPNSQSGKKDITKVFFVFGAAMLLKKEAIIKAGMLDEKFFLMVEEIDLCHRISKEGFDCLYVPKACVWHKGSNSFGDGKNGPQQLYYFHRNRLLFLYKHYSFLKRLKFYRYLIKNEMLINFAMLCNDETTSINKKRLRSVFKGIFHYFISSFGKSKQYN